MKKVHFVCSTCCTSVRSPFNDSTKNGEAPYCGVLVNRRRLSMTMGLAVLLFAFCGRLAGQAVNATLVGTVTDTTGAAVAAAKVEIKEVNTGITRTSETNESGNYVFSDLEPGRYQVSAGKTGFKRVVHDPVDVLVNTTVRVDVKLEPGTITETIEVKAETPILQTDSADTGRKIETRQVEDLPLTFNRNFQSLLNLVPGTTRGHREHSAFFNAQDSLRTEVNGQSGLANNLQFEGLNDNERTGLLSIYIPPIEAVQTVDVTTSSYDAELGRANGAVTNVILKSGTNEFHGAAYEINRISTLAAVPFFQNKAVVDRLPSVYNYYGANIGGPIWKNKTFFFGDFLRINDHQGQFNQVTVPPAAFRNGDFSGITAKIYDPATNASGVGRTQFVASSNPSDPRFNPLCTNAAGCPNMIPVARISPIAKAILAKIPLPNVPGKALTATNNFQGPTKFIKDTTSFDVKIDHNFSQSQRLSGRFSFSDQSLSQSPIFGLVGGPSNGAFSGTGTQRFWDVAVNYYRVFSPTLIMEIRAGVDHYRNVANNTDRGKTVKDEIGVDIPGANLGDLNTSGLPCIVLTNNNGDNCLVGYSASLPWIRGETNLNVANNWTKIRGNHTFKWGMDYHRLRDDLAQWQDQNPRGVFRFTSNVTSTTGATPNNQANPVAAFLLDVPNSAGRDVPLNAKAFRGNELFAYAADKWQVSQKLTLDLGLRWEFYPPFTPRAAGRFSNFDPATKSLIIAGVGGNPSDLGRTTNYHDFAPRIGVAYRLTPETVVRGGFALSYFPYPDNDYAFNFPVLQNNAFPDNGSGFGQAQLAPGQPVSVSGGFPAPIVASIPANGIIPVTGTVGTTKLFSQNYTAVNLNFREPYTESWNLAVQRSLPGKFVLEAAYVGNHGVDIPTVYNLNASRVAGSGNAGRPLWSVAAPLTGTVAFKFMGTSSNYHALQAKLDRKLSGGLLITTAYTYGKAMGYATDGENTINSTVGGIPFYIGDFRRNYSPLYFSRTHTFVQSVILELPFGKGKRLLSSGVGSKILGGWEISTILTAMTGLPLQITGGSNLGAPGNTGVPDLIGPINVLHGINSSPWFDVTPGTNNGQPCLGVVCKVPDCPGPGCRVGNIARRVFSGPGLFNLDGSVFRRFPIKERIGLEFRAEAFSLTNTPHFDRPGTNFDSTSSFGVVTGTRGGFDAGNRAIQLGAKLTF